MLIIIIIILVLVVIIYLYLIKAKSFNREHYKDFLDSFYAHRGLHQGRRIPENSLKAFHLALEKGYGIELDVRLTKDGVPVVFHDDNLKRMCGIDKDVIELSYEEIKALRLYDTDERIPHLQEVLDLVDGKVPLIVELKIFDDEKNQCKIIAPCLDRYKGVYCIESFNPRVLIWYKKHRPHVIRGQLATKNVYDNPNLKERLINLLLRNLMLNFLTEPDFIAYNYKYSHFFSFTLCRLVYRPLTIAYTITSQKQLDRYRKRFQLFIFENFTPR